MPKKFWQFRNQAAGSAELLLYGDISDSSWWGDEVTPKTFADELNALGALTSLTVRINSGGGDVFAAQTIGNLLEQHTAQVTARIDGLCASAATIIACHCDKVVAAKVTAVATAGKHPYHLVHTDSTSTVYGWVDAAAITGKASATPAVKTYTVKAGDSLWRIAAQQLGNGARYKEIKTLNGLKNNTIHAGQVLKLPN